MKFQATVTFEYEVDPTDPHGAYGTTNPELMAAVDESQAESDLTLFIDLIVASTDYQVRIVPSESST